MFRLMGFLIPTFVTWINWTVACQGCDINTPLNEGDDSSTCSCPEHQTAWGREWKMSSPGDCEWSFSVQESNILLVHQRGLFRPGWDYRNACLSLETDISDPIKIYNTSGVSSEGKWCFQGNLTIKFRGDMCFYPDPQYKLTIIVREIETNKSFCEDGRLVRYECANTSVNMTYLPVDENQCSSLIDMKTQQPPAGMMKDKVLLVLTASLSSVVLIVIVTSAVAIYRYCQQSPVVNLYSHLNISQKYIPPPSDPNRPLPSLPATQDYVLHNLTGPNHFTGSVNPANSETESQKIYQDADSVTSDMDKEVNMDYSLLQEEEVEEGGAYTQCPADSMYSYEGPAASRPWATFGPSKKNTGKDFKKATPEYSTYHCERAKVHPEQAPKINKLNGGYEKVKPIFMVNPDFKQDSVYSYEQPVDSLKTPDPVVPDYEEVSDQLDSPIPSVKEDEKPSEAAKSMTRGMSYEPKTAEQLRLKGVWKAPHQQGEDLELKHRPYSYPCFTKF